MRSFSLKYSAIIIPLATVLTTGCKKLVTVNPPVTELVSSTVFTDMTTATAAQLEIYSQIQGTAPTSSYFIPLATGYTGDELQNYSSDIRLVEYYANTINAVDNTFNFNLWAAAYSWIYQANAVIGGLQNADGVPPAVRTQLTGEAKFVRAFAYFYLTNLWGAVPLVTTTSYSTNALEKKADQSSVYQQIISDLTDAQSLLNSNYVDQSDTTASQSRVRPNKAAASALLARVYLYTGDYKDAFLESDAILANTAIYGLASDPNDVFQPTSKEAIWQLAMPQPNSINTYEGEYFNLSSGLSTGQTNCAALSNNLMMAFEPYDRRRTAWVDSLISGTTVYYFPFKFKVMSGSNITEVSTPLRLAEQYLIHAEAQAEGAGGGASAAVSDLDFIRFRAGLSNYTGPTDKASLLNAIMHERQVELFTEWGHRWMDLKRTGMIDSVMTITDAWKTPATSWSSNWALYPIPQSEITSDPNLNQNIGY